MKVHNYVALKASRLGLSRVIDYVKEDKSLKKMIVNTSIFAHYKQRAEDTESLLRKENRMFFFDLGMDHNAMIEESLMYATLSFLGATLSQVEAELATLVGAKEEGVKVQEVESVPPKPEEEKPVIIKKKKKASKKKASKKKVEEPKPELPVEEDEFTDLGDDVIEVQEELFLFEKPKHAPLLSKKIAETLGVDWKSDAKSKAKVSKLLKELETVKCFNALGEGTKELDQLVDSVLA